MYQTRRSPAPSGGVRASEFCQARQHDGSENNPTDTCKSIGSVIDGLLVKIAHRAIENHKRRAADPRSTLAERKAAWANVVGIQAQLDRLQGAV